VRLTYGEVAKKVGKPKASRAVGAAVGANPWPVLVPCHRVVGTGGRMTGFSAPGGVAAKRRMLAMEDRGMLFR
jgi:methylated-DNA-[protein]-cysteine S-methyltransferase